MTTNWVLDHVAVVVPNLDEAEVAFSALGFNLSPRSSHKGALEPGGPVQLWGTGNHCAMFEQGYFEVLGVTDPSRHHEHVRQRLARYAGLHLIALGCDDAAAAADLLRTRLGDNPDPAEVQRDVPRAGGGPLPGRFNILPLSENAFPEADLFLIEHLTPDALWQPDVLQQPNTITALAGVGICSDEVEQTSARLSRVLGVRAHETGGANRYNLARGWIEVFDHRENQRRFGAGTELGNNFVTSVAFQVSDIDAVARILERSEFACAPYADNGLCARVAGASLIFSEAAS